MFSESVSSLDIRKLVDEDHVWYDTMDKESTSNVREECNLYNLVLGNSYMSP